ncbi:uncharacterized RNA methyltransferase [Tanacetum coccineum]
MFLRPNTTTIISAADVIKFLCLQTLTTSLPLPHPHHRVHSTVLTLNRLMACNSNVIFGNRWRHILGERDFWEHVGGIDVYLAPSSFGQANTRAFDALLQKLHKYVPLGASVTDLYAGAGVIGLSLASTRKCRKDLSVRCVEINKESKLAFEKTIERLPSSLDSSISWHHADTSLVSIKAFISTFLLLFSLSSCMQ